MIIILPKRVNGERYRGLELSNYHRRLMPAEFPGRRLFAQRFARHDRNIRIFNDRTNIKREFGVFTAGVERY